MPAHDWTRVEDGIYHSFHTWWLSFLGVALNSGVLPKGCYALSEQHAGKPIVDVMALQIGDSEQQTDPPPSSSGGIAVADAPPKVRRRQTLSGSYLNMRRTLAIRHVSNHRLIAIIEILSPGNKDRQQHLDAIVAKVESALDAGVHVLIIDLIPPRSNNPFGIHGLIHKALEPEAHDCDLPADEPLTLASYAAGPQVEIYIEHVGVGGALPDMPLFIESGRYVNVALEQTYMQAFTGMPEFWKEVLTA